MNWGIDVGGCPWFARNSSRSCRVSLFSRKPLLLVSYFWKIFVTNSDINFSLSSLRNIFTNLAISFFWTKPSPFMSISSKNLLNYGKDDGGIFLLAKKSLTNRKVSRLSRAPLLSISYLNQILLTVSIISSRSLKLGFFKNSLKNFAISFFEITPS